MHYRLTLLLEWHVVIKVSLMFILQIGCPNEPEDFVVSGTCSEQLYGMCEALWEPNLKPDELFETISQV